MKTLDTPQILRRFPLFATLSDTEMQLISDNSEVLKRPKFNFLYHFDDPSDTTFLLIKGIVKTGLHSDDGREIIKNVIHPGAVFGELGVVGERCRTEFARAMNEDVTVCAVKVSAIRSIMSRNAELAFKMMDKIGERLRKTEGKLEALIFKDARERIIDFIRNTAENRGRKVGFEMMFKHCLTQQDIANLTGTSRQTVTSVLNELRKENKIYFNRRSILIRDMEGLA